MGRDVIGENATVTVFPDEGEKSSLRSIATSQAAPVQYAICPVVSALGRDPVTVFTFKRPSVPTTSMLEPSAEIRSSAGIFPPPPDKVISSPSKVSS